MSSNELCDNEYELPSESTLVASINSNHNKSRERSKSIIVIDSDDSDDCEKNFQSEALFTPKNVESPFLCSICGDDLSLYSSVIREWHLNNCLDILEDKTDDAVTESKKMKTTSAVKNYIDNLMKDIAKSYM
ncbi:14388_t:CDS:1, partial [Acaulospora colombiana]